MDLFEYAARAAPDEYTLQTRFAAFHRDNPHVYTILVRLAREALAKGKRRIGIKMLFEVARWEVFLSTTADDFKLNNNYHSRYARLIMEREPGMAGVFEVRALKA